MIAEPDEKSTNPEVRGNQEAKELRSDSHGGEAVRGVSEGDGPKRVSSHRKNRSSRNRIENLTGGILDQLIEDTRKQLAKTRECIVWYQSELDEYREKLQHLEELKALEESEDEEDDEIDNLQA